MSDELIEKWLGRFGYPGLREGQAAVVGRLLEGVSCLALFPTGGGKSLCYQLPAMCLPGLSVVVSPLLALMREQVDALKSRELPVERLDSTQDDNEQLQIISRIRKGELKLLFVSPERFINASFRSLLRDVTLGLIAVDEAHCVSEWGQRFRPDYLKLGKAMRGLGFKCKLALTATASKEVIRDVRKAFGIRKMDTVRTSMTRPELSLEVRHLTASEERLDRLVEALADSPGLPAIVYVRVQKTAEAVSAAISQAGFDARAYHAGMNPEAREMVQTAFINDEIEVVVATIAFGMGIDKPNLRQVIHYDLPSSIEAYQQETGRAGRDRQNSRAVALVAGSDWSDLQNRIAAGSVSVELLDALLRRLAPHEGGRWFSAYDASTELDISREFIEVLLAKLEMAGQIKLGRRACKRIKVSILKCNLKGYSRIQKEMLTTLGELREIRDSVEFCEEKEWDLGMLADLLQEAEAAGDIRYTPSHWLISLHGTKKSFPQPAELAPWLEQRTVREEERLKLLEQLLCSKICIAKRLARYFGENDASDCGKCSVCRGTKLPRKLKTSFRSLSNQDLTLMEELMSTKHALARPVTLARFLVGLYSPAIGRFRLTRHSAYGSLANCSFQELEIQAKSMKKR